MRLKFLLSTVLAVCTTAAHGAPADFVGTTSSLSLDHTTAVPGDTLKAGSYRISVTEQLADRMIVRIDSTTSKDHAIFLGVPSSATKLRGGSGAVAWGAGINKTQTIRGFVFPNGNAVEFVYPKADAAGLAKDNGAVVIALDPRSEGKVALKSLSQDELQIVNLWLLSMTATGADNKTPAVLARHYEGPQNVPQPVGASSVQPVYPITPGPLPAPAPVQRALRLPAPVVEQAPTVKKISPVVAKNSAVETRTPVNKAEPRRAAAKTTPDAAPQVAALEEPTMPKSTTSSRRAPVIAQLPHTAGVSPLVWMIGLFSLLGAALVRMGRSRLAGRVQG